MSSGVELRCSSYTSSLSRLLEVAPRHNSFLYFQCPINSHRAGLTRAVTWSGMHCWVAAPAPGTSVGFWAVLASWVTVRGHLPRTVMQVPSVNMSLLRIIINT